MTDREDKVYKAKLAEQAERYDGEICCISVAVAPVPGVSDLAGELVVILEHQGCLGGSLRMQDISYH